MSNWFLNLKKNALRIIRLIGWKILLVALLAAFFLLLPTDSFNKTAIETIRGVSSSIVAAFIFYLFMDVAKRCKDLKTTLPYAFTQVNALKGILEGICRELARINNEELPADWNLNSDDIERLFSSINPNLPANMVRMDHTPVSIIEYIYERSLHIENRLQKLSAIGYYLDSVISLQIKKIFESSFLTTLKCVIDSNRMNNIRNTDISFLTTSFIKFHSEVLILEQHLQKL